MQLIATTYQRPLLAWEGEDINAVYPVLLALVCFVIYWFISQSEGIQSRFYKGLDFDKASSSHIFFTKLTGFILMGIVPAILAFMISPDNTPASFGVRLISDTALFTLYWTLGLGAVLMILAFLTAGKEENLKHYPQVRAKEWSLKTALLYAAGWALYLTGYEFLFRGILLFPLVDTMGVWPAIAINVGMYSATHIPKGLKETVGAIPLGLLLCILTLYSGTLWIAIFAHLIMALSNSFRALYLQPDMHFKFR